MILRATILLAILCLCLTDGLKAQKKEKSIFFFKNSGVLVSTRDSADYIREISEPDSGSTLYALNDIYPNGNKKFSGKTSTRQYLQLEGEAEYYYPSGTLKEKVSHEAGKRLGESFVYYPNGKLYARFEYLPSPVGQLESYNIIEYRDSTGNVLVSDGNGYFKYYATTEPDFYEEGRVKNKVRDGEWKGRSMINKAPITFTEIYEEGRQISGRSIDINGNAYTYIKRTKMPEFTGGIPAFSSYLATNIVYPKKSKKDDISGKVILSFVVNLNGSIEGVKIISSPAADLSAEAKRIIERSPNWQPGEYYGIPVRVQYTQPINFALN